MGVLGITPFLQKICPHVFKTLPDRFRSLRRKTVVIDATLVTQRFHFAPMPHPHRHLIGWHRILTELKESDVRAICVFDGKQRSAAKAPEVERRRESRKIDAARGSIELNRFHRLQKLIRLLPYYRSLPTSDRQRVIDTLTNISPSHRSSRVYPSGSTSPLSVFSPPHLPPSRPPVTSYSFPHSGLGIRDVQDVLDSVAASPLPSRFEPQYMPPSAYLDNAVHDSCDSIDDPPHDIFSSLPFVHWNTAVQSTPISYQPPDSIQSFQSELSTLYSEYNHCIAQLSSMPSSLEQPEIPKPAHDHDPPDTPDFLEATIEYSMSKQQLQMTLDEGHIWNLLSSPCSEVPQPEIESALMELAKRSTFISKSYQRRSNSPTTQTYEECKELLRAMGVPCIESSSPFEAEALACTLVAHGHADYVVSEDTDVLIYEAPMLRGITSRESPVVVVHGEDIRTTLLLDRTSYIDFALLLGTDFSQRIKNVGPNRALKFIRQHGSIERVVEQESMYPPRVPVPDYLAQVGVARLVFQSLPPLPDVGLLHQTEGDPDALSEIIQRYGLQRILPGAWDNQSTLAGNYFGDDPSVW